MQNLNLRPFPGTTQCDCSLHCHHRHPEITYATRANHRRDEEIHHGRRIRRGDPYYTFQSQRAQPTADRDGPTFPSLSRGAQQPSERENEAGFALVGEDESAFQTLEAELELRKLRCITPLATPLVFRNPPKENGPFHRELATPVDLNTGLYALHLSHKNNARLVENERRLHELLQLALVLPPCERRLQLLDRIHEGLEATLDEKALHWMQQRLSIDMDEVIVYNEKNFVRLRTWPPAVVASMVISAMMSHLFHVPRIGGTVLLAGLQDVLKALPGQKAYPHLIPRDPRTVVAALNLDPVTIRYISCVKCHALRKFSDVGPGSVCDEKITVGSEPCGQPLVEEIQTHDRVRWKPLCTVLLQDLKSWIGQLFSRPGIEDVLTSYPHGVMNDPQQEQKMTDIWGSSMILTIDGPDGKPFFHNRSKDDKEIRLLFSLAGDGFNPFHNSTAKQNTSSLGFWLVLLNFPPHMRFRFNNVFYLGSLPPKTPPVDRYWPILSLITKTLQEFWQPGVYFTQTYKYPEGRLAKGMLSPRIGDMLAIRAIEGFTSATSTQFCIACPTTYGKIEDFHIENWGTRDFEDYKRHANEWKNAETVAAQRSIADKYIRGSPLLLDLSYARSVGFATVEPMHALDLGLIQQHCRRLLRIDEEQNGGDGSGPRMQRPLVQDMHTLRNDIASILDLFKVTLDRNDFVNTISAHSCATYRTLWYTCYVYNLRIAGGPNHREWYIRRIRLWMSNLSEQERNDLTVATIPQFKKPPDSFDSIFAAAELRLQQDARTKHPNATPNQIADCVTLLKRIYRGTKKKSIKETKSVFVDLCHILDVKRKKKNGTLVNFVYSTNTHIQEMYDALKCDPTIKGDMDKIASPSLSKEGGAILGKDVMDAIKTDMDKTILPSWVAAVPRSWGTKARGKLSANQWKVLFTIHFPITLVWLWRDKIGRMKEVLHNILLLVLIVEIAGLKEISPDLAKAYSALYEKYAVEIMALFKEDDITPVIHDAGHIGANLLRFGPSHSRGAQFYERFIHALQQTNTNNKTGEMEETFMRSTAHTANLKSLIEGNKEIRSHVTEALKAFQKGTNQHNEGLALASLYELDDPSINMQVHTRWAFLSDEDNQLMRTYLAKKSGQMDVDTTESKPVRILDEIEIDQLRYTRTGISSRDCDAGVLTQFQVDGKIEYVGGLIQNIIEVWHPDSECWSTYLIVVLFERTNEDPEAPQDPYQAWSSNMDSDLYRQILGCLCQPLTRDSLRVVVEPKDVLSPIARTEILQQVHIRPLTRYQTLLQHWIDHDGSESSEP